MPKSITGNVPAPATNPTNATNQKLPLFMGGEYGNALAQITFTFDEWQSLITAINKYAQFDYAGVYQYIKDRVTDQSQIKDYTLNLYCYKQIDVEVLEFIALAVIHTPNANLSAKIITAIDGIVSYWLTNQSSPFNRLEITIESNSLSDSLQHLKRFSPIAIKGGN